MITPEERLKRSNTKDRHRTPEEKLFSNMRREMIFESNRSSGSSGSSRSHSTYRTPEEKLVSNMRREMIFESDRSSQSSRSSRSSRSHFDKKRTKDKAREIFDSEKPRPAVLIGGGVPQIVGGGVPQVVVGGVPQVVVGGMPIGQAIPIMHRNGITFLTPRAPIAVIQPRIIAPSHPQIVLGAAPFPIMFNGIRFR